jgi:hypothetical protein
MQALADLQEVRSAKDPLQSGAIIKWHDEGGHSGFFNVICFKIPLSKPVEKRCFTRDGSHTW